MPSRLSGAAAAEEEPLAVGPVVGGDDLPGERPGEVVAVLRATSVTAIPCRISGDVDERLGLLAERHRTDGRITSASSTRSDGATASVSSAQRTMPSARATSSTS